MKDIEEVLESPRRACYSKLVIGAEDCFAFLKVVAELTNYESVIQVSESKIANVDRPEMEAGSGYCLLKPPVPN